MRHSFFKKPASAEAKTMVLESSMDDFLRMQEHQRDFLDWLENQDVEAADLKRKSFRAVR